MIRALVFGLACVALPAAAAPKLAAPRAAGPLTVYPDDRRADLFYYGPGDLAVEADADGRPRLTLLQTRYTGTTGAGTKGTIAFRSLLTLDVAQTGGGSQAMAAVRLAARLPRSAELRPLPETRLTAKVVYAAAAPAATPTPLPEGHFEEPAEATAPSSTWSRRTYVLPLDVTASQLLADAMRHGRLLLSLDYAFHVRSGDTDVLVRSGTTAVSIDVQRWPTLLRQIDVNEHLPPAYAALDVYCYDFQDSLRPDLYEKQVEIEAEGVGGGRVTTATTFGATQPDLYARSLRFPVAVRFDRPYRFRVTETATDGRARSGPWTASASWERVLDVTSAPARHARPTPEDQP